MVWVQLKLSGRPASAGFSRLKPGVRHLAQHRRKQAVLGQGSLERRTFQGRLFQAGTSYAKLITTLNDVYVCICWLILWNDWR